MSRRHSHSAHPSKPHIDPLLLTPARTRDPRASATAAAAAVGAAAVAVGRAAAPSHPPLRDPPIGFDSPPASPRALAPVTAPAPTLAPAVASPRLPAARSRASAQAEMDSPVRLSAAACFQAPPLLPRPPPPVPSHSPQPPFDHYEHKAQTNPKRQKGEDEPPTRSPRAARSTPPASPRPAAAAAAAGAAAATAAASPRRALALGHTITKREEHGEESAARQKRQQQIVTDRELRLREEQEEKDKQLAQQLQEQFNGAAAAAAPAAAPTGTSLRSSNGSCRKRGAADDDDDFCVSEGEEEAEGEAESFAAAARDSLRKGRQRLKNSGSGNAAHKKARMEALPLKLTDSSADAAAAPAVPLAMHTSPARRSAPATDVQPIDVDDDDNAIDQLEARPAAAVSAASAAPDLTRAKAVASHATPVVAASHSASAGKSIASLAPEKTFVEAHSAPNKQKSDALTAAYQRASIAILDPAPPARGRTAAAAHKSTAAQRQGQAARPAESLSLVEMVKFYRLDEPACTSIRQSCDGTCAAATFESHLFFCVCPASHFVFVCHALSP